ncbi:MAG: hypothetical protein CMA65_03390, partial [Euryarchaeota archaeon]|nr:hypothetical protein [Euryarchaeota archaeon]
YAAVGETHLHWRELVSDYDAIRDLMERSLNGFDNYNERVRASNGFQLPNPPRDSQSFATPDKRAHFTTHHLPNLDVPDGHYVMMTLRSHDQYNTTIYGLSDRYRGVSGNRRIVFMNASDMVERGWKSRTLVSITSHFEGQQRHSKNWMVVPYDIPSGNIATYFPEANSLVPLHSTADQSNTPTSKWIVCSMNAPNDVSREEE